MYSLHIADRNKQYMDEYTLFGKKCPNTAKTSCKCKVKKKNKLVQICFRHHGRGVDDENPPPFPITH